MTPWLHATVLALVVGSSPAVLPPGEWPTGTIRPYDTEPRPLRSTSASIAPGAFGWSSPPPGLPVPTYGPVHRPAQGSTPRGTTAPARSASPANQAPDHGPRHTPVSPPPPSPGHPSDSAQAHGPRRASPSPSLAPSPSAATPSRAGSRAGEGRERPGRRDEPVTEDDDSTSEDSTSTEGTGTDTGDGDLSAVPEPPHGTAAASAPRRAAQTAAKVFILPLGTGLVLIGLGLGLALFALRLRRG